VSRLGQAVSPPCKATRSRSACAVKLPNDDGSRGADVRLTREPAGVGQVHQFHELGAGVAVTCEVGVAGPGLSRRTVAGKDPAAARPAPENQAPVTRLTRRHPSGILSCKL
jgi:hypothetical protein